MSTFVEERPSRWIRLRLALVALLLFALFGVIVHRAHRLQTVDSPWLPGYAGIDTRDYFHFPDQWLMINLDLLQRFPDAVWIPGFWVEFGDEVGCLIHSLQRDPQPSRNGWVIPVL